MRARDILVCLAVALSLTSGRFVLAQKPGAAPDAAALLERYAAGAHEAVARELAAVREFELLRKTLEKLAPDWAARAGPGEKPRRALVAATFLLEVARAGLETDWGHLKILVELGCGMIRANGSPSDFERLWMLASIALGAAARDASFLVGSQAPVVDAPSRVREHLNHARRRFPQEPRLRLASAVAAEFSTGEPSRRGERLTSEQDQWRAARTKSAIEQFMKVAEIPEVAAEAEMHLGYLWFQVPNGRQALTHLRIASERSNDPYVTYLAHFLAGRVLVRQKQAALAEAAFRNALLTLPGTQSASEALASLLFVDGQRDEAYALVETSFNHRPLPPDPWRLYGYGDFRRWPDLVRQLREAIR